MNSSYQHLTHKTTVQNYQPFHVNNIEIILTPNKTKNIIPGPDGIQNKHLKKPLKNNIRVVLHIERMYKKIIRSRYMENG